MTFAKSKNTNLTTVTQHVFRPRDFIATIIATFNQDIRQQGLNEPRRCVFRKRHYPVDGRQSGKNRHTIFQRIDWSCLALQLANRVIVINRNDKAITQAFRLFEIGHMSGVQNIKTTVCHDDGFASTSCFFDQWLQFFFSHKSPATLPAPM